MPQFDFAAVTWPQLAWLALSFAILYFGVIRFTLPKLGKVMGEREDKIAGDIAAAVGLKDVTTGETLCSPDKVIVLEKMEFPDPVIELAIEPKSKADQEKLGVALSKLAPGIDVSPPRSNRSCCTPVSSSRTGTGSSSHNNTPITELSSSTSPIACTRSASLSIRLPSPRPVVPASPVRVAIFESLLPIISFEYLNKTERIRDFHASFSFASILR